MANQKDDAKQRSKSNKKYNGRARNSRNSTKQVDVRDERIGKVDNDPNWYFTSAELADQASTFSFNSFLGERILSEVWYPASSGVAVNYGSMRLQNPNILAVSLNPSPGTTASGFSEVSGVNVTALKTYTMISSRNGKTTNYAPQDITALILGMGEVVSIIEHLRRAFGCVYTYNQRNRTMPKRLIERMGIDYDDFIEHLASYRTLFNSLITSVNKIPFPTNIAYISKCLTIYQKVYLDSESPMATLVFSRPNSTWLIDEISSERGTQLKTVALEQYYTTPTSFLVWADQLKTMITELTTSITFNYIYSDILMLRDKYSLPLFYMDYLSADYTVIPEYNLMYLLQVHNSNAIDMPLATVPDGFDNVTPNNDVLPDVATNTIKYNPAFTLPTVTQPQITDPLIDVPFGNPDVATRIEVTRYISCPNPHVVTPSKEGNAQLFAQYVLPDHYVARYELETGEGGTGSLLQFANNLRTSEMSNGNIFAMAGINWAPIIYYTDEFTTEGDSHVMVLSELDYFTTLDKNWFIRTNDLIFMSLFEIR